MDRQRRMTIVRLAGVMSLMEWAETDAYWLPVGAAHIEAAYELWSGYYLPHALAVFDRSGIRPGDPIRAPRRALAAPGAGARDLARGSAARGALPVGRCAGRGGGAGAARGGRVLAGGGGRRFAQGRPAEATLGGHPAVSAVSATFVRLATPSANALRSPAMPARYPLMLFRTLRTASLRLAHERAGGSRSGRK